MTRWRAASDQACDSALHRPGRREQYAEYEGWAGGDLASLLAFLEANDNGSNMQDVIEIRQRKGLRDADGNVYKIGKAVAEGPRQRAGGVGADLAM